MLWPWGVREIRADNCKMKRERWAMIRTFQFLFNSCILQHGHYLGDLGGAIPLQSGYVAIVFMILSQLIGFIAMVSANNNPNCTPEILFINSSNRYIHLNPYIYIYTCIYIIEGSLESNFRQYGQMKREKRKIRRKKSRREIVRRKKMQMREKVGKSRNTLFFQ